MSILPCIECKTYLAQTHLPPSIRLRALTKHGGTHKHTPGPPPVLHDTAKSSATPAILFNQYITTWRLAHTRVRGVLLGELEYRSCRRQGRPRCCFLPKCAVRGAPVRRVYPTSPQMRKTLMGCRRERHGGRGASDACAGLLAAVRWGGSVVFI